MVGCECGHRRREKGQWYGSPECGCRRPVRWSLRSQDSTLQDRIRATGSGAVGREGVPIAGVEAGPRGHHWREDQPATILWTEALDGGDPKTNVPFRDRVMALAAPFAGEPSEIGKTEWRSAGISYTEKGVALLS